MLLKVFSFYNIYMFIVGCKIILNMTGLQENLCEK